MCGKEWVGFPSLFSKHYFRMSVSFEKAGYSLIEYRQMAIYYTVGSPGQNSGMEMETPLFDPICLSVSPSLGGTAPPSFLEMLTPLLLLNDLFGDAYFSRNIISALVGNLNNFV